MQIIHPAHNRPATDCQSWGQIKIEAHNLRQLIKRGNFPGRYKTAFAISHAQVSESPLHFFVVDENFNKGQLVETFGSWVIMNFKILEEEEMIMHNEACMSFEYRRPKNVPRYRKIKASYYIPFLGTWRKVTRKFRDLPALIIQHEMDHSLGKNIYGK